MSPPSIEELPGLLPAEPDSFAGGRLDERYSDVARPMA